MITKPDIAIVQETNWPCEVCGTPDEHVLLTSGSLNAGTLRAHTFCPEHNPLSKRKAAQ